MGTTTIKLIRENQKTLINALTPTSLSDEKFQAFEGKGTFADWVQKNKQACFRHYHIADVFQYEEPLVSDLSSEELYCRLELSVSYPVDGRYGSLNDEDLRDIINDDMHQLDGSIGLRGHGTFVVGQIGAWFADYEIEQGSDVWILKIGIRINFRKQL